MISAARPSLTTAPDPQNPDAAWTEDVEFALWGAFERQLFAAARAFVLELDKRYAKATRKAATATAAAAAIGPPPPTENTAEDGNSGGCVEGADTAYKAGGVFGLEAGNGGNIDDDEKEEAERQQWWRLRMQQRKELWQHPSSGTVQRGEDVTDKQRPPGMKGVVPFGPVGGAQETVSLERAKRKDAARRLSTRTGVFGLPRYERSGKSSGVRSKNEAGRDQDDEEEEDMIHSRGRVGRPSVTLPSGRT